VTATTAFAAGPGKEIAASTEAPFLKENSDAMMKMMDGMGVEPSGDIDQDFVAMMIPHHQGAIDMAQAELRYGKNERLRRIAQEIIVEQQQEIVAMDVALDKPLPRSTACPEEDLLGTLNSNDAAKHGHNQFGATSTLLTHQDKK
jgi:hypothetical protein